MEKVPLMPSRKPVPSVLQKQKQGDSVTEFQYSNTEYLSDKTALIQKYWKIISKMDPNGDLFTSDHGMVIVDGEYPDSESADSRRPEALGLTEDDMEVIEKFAIPDATEEDREGKIVPSSVVGVVFTMYQMVEAMYHEAFAAGELSAKSKITDALVSSVPEDDEDLDDDYEDEDELDFEPQVDVLTDDVPKYDLGDESF